MSERGPEVAASPGRARKSFNSRHQLTRSPANQGNFDLLATIVFDHRQPSAITERVELFGRATPGRAGLRRAANAVTLRF